MQLDRDLCTGCKICSQECSVHAIEMESNLPRFGENCVRCGLCVTICPAKALLLPTEERAREIRCDHCPVGCQIPVGYLGACQRYRNERNTLKPARPLVLPLSKALKDRYRQTLISQPLITAIGAGSTYPDYIPAPYAAQKKVGDVDVVTVVSESPLTYSSIMVKIDTDRFIGDETATVKYRGAAVGHVTTEQYGSKMISIGGVNIMKTKSRLKTTRLIVDIANNEPFTLKVHKGARLELQVGHPPVIDKIAADAMKIACGAGIMGIFGLKLKDLADEIIILDSDITGLFSESHVGHILGFKPSGIKPPGRYSTPGRYFGDIGNGWGGTNITDPLQAFSITDPDKVWDGMKVLILEVTGRHSALLQADQNKQFHPLAVPPTVEEIKGLIQKNKENSLTSAVYMGGCGGSARAGITAYPIKLNQAVHNGDVRLTVGGVPAYVMPGGGINFLVDVAKMRWRPFSWTPSPAVVVPLEYTMEKETYFRLGGHQQNLTTLEDLLQERETRPWDEINS
ncbi:MAG: 4Fe-4S binding protein [Desulfobacterales bacterium]|nr:4Fe-4S binding protein [Desulfobacterales bacterium]